VQLEQILGAHPEVHVVVHPFPEIGLTLERQIGFEKDRLAAAGRGMGLEATAGMEPRRYAVGKTAEVIRLTGFSGACQTAGPSCNNAWPGRHISSRAGGGEQRWVK
jgi:hypothetical protein